MVVSSTLNRAIQTAECIIQKYHSNVPFYQMKELDEMDYGEFEGKVIFKLFCSQHKFPI